MPIRATVSVKNIQALTSAVKPTTSILFQIASATEIWTDPDSKNKLVYDEFPLSDIKFYVLHKNLTDTANLVEFEKWSFEKNSTEAIALVESFARVVAYRRTFSDAFTLDDLSQIDKDFYGNKGNVTFMTDIIGLAHEKLLTDTYTVSDVFKNVISYIRKFTETVAVTDHATQNFIKNINDAFTLDDASLINKDFTGDKGNIFGFSDLLGNAFEKNLTDSITYLDNVSVLQTLNKTDSTVLSDSHRTTLNKAIADAFTLDDSALIDKDYYGNKNNIVGFSDELSYETSKEVADALALVDLVGFLLNHPEEDDITVSDTHLLSYNLGRPETLTFSDSYIRNITKGLNDGFALDDSTQINKDTSNTKGNIFSISEVFARSVDYKRSYLDSVGFTDTFNRVVQFNPSFNDSTTLTEIKDVNLSKRLHDSFDVYDHRVLVRALNSHTLNTSALNGQAKVYQGSSNINLTQDTNKADGLSFSEISVLLSSKGITDNIITNDQQYIEIQKALQDVTTVQDNLSSNVSKGFTDSTILNDALYRKSTKSLTDSTNIHDILGVTFDKVVTDGFALDDSALVNKNFYGNKGNIVAMGDVVAVTKVGRRLLNGASFNRTQLN
jgi:hypothetical protein